MRTFALAGALLLGAAILPSTADAAPVGIASYSAAVGGGATGNVRDNLDTITAGVTATGIGVSIANNAQIVTGSSTGVYAAPYLSGQNGAGFGNTVPGVDTTQYITSGSTGSVATAKVTLTLPSLSDYFGLLWGSVDDYNKIEFFNGDDFVGSLGGQDVIDVATGGLIPQNQGINGTVYANIRTNLFFNKIVLTSTQFAFEFDNVAVPIPGAVLLFGSALAGLGVMRRRRKGETVPAAA